MYMKRTPRIAWLMPVLALSLAACYPREPIEPRPEPVPEEIDGWAPVYNTTGDYTTVKSMAPQNIVNGGKIYVKGDTLYQVEAGKGIHVILIKQPANPQKVAFISVVGAQELAVKNSMLYTNNLNDLVVLDISQTDSVKLVDRISNVFNMVDSLRPPGTGYYECVDYKKGKVVGWEQKLLKYPKCRN
jgi:hypothetical protein